MLLLPLLLGAGIAASPPSEALLRRIVAETAVAQLGRIDPAWPEPQRDCAGLVRFAYRTAFKRLDPARAAAGPFRDASGEAVHFADAATLLAGSFTLLGRDEHAREALRSGDLVAFAREGEDGAAVHHLMLVIRPDDPAAGRTLVVYHPGPGAQGGEGPRRPGEGPTGRGRPEPPRSAVRSGSLDALLRDAPRGWRPAPENPLFVGFFRLKDFTP